MRCKKMMHGTKPKCDAYRARVHGQIPALYFDHMVRQGRGGSTHVVVTQPRRISATSVAERVAAERAEPLGQTVGYAIRQESVPPKTCGSILFCTTGVLTRKLTARRPGTGDLDNVSVVFVDEVHERDVHSDFLLIILKRCAVPQPTHPRLRTVWQSYVHVRWCNICAYATHSSDVNKGACAMAFEVCWCCCFGLACPSIENLHQ
jgi:hypothetical protein